MGVNIPPAFYWSDQNVSLLERLGSIPRHEPGEFETNLAQNGLRALAKLSLLKSSGFGFESPVQIS